MTRRQMFAMLAAIPLASVLCPPAHDGVYDIRTMPEYLIPRCRVWMNGRNITKDFKIRYVDVRRGLARCLARDARRAFYVDPATGKLATEELRGRFVVTMDGPCALERNPYGS